MPRGNQGKNEGYGGIRSCDMLGYMQSRHVSPCVYCDRLYDDKEVCATNCTHLFYWQVETKAVSVIEIEGRANKIGSLHVCEECGGPLRFDDGVIYCVECFEVFYRKEEGETHSKGIAYLISKNWSVDAIAKLYNVKPRQIMEAANKEGLFVAKRHQKEKAVIADYALNFGSAKAAQKYDLHPETVNRFMRELGVGAKSRADRLRSKGMRLLGTGQKPRRVADILGVNVTTVYSWATKLKN